MEIRDFAEGDVQDLIYVWNNSLIKDRTCARIFERKVRDAIL